MMVGDIRLRPFNSLKLRDVYAADLQGDTLLYVENLSTGFRLWPLLRSRLVIRSVELDNFAVHLRRDSIGTPFNFQFFIDAFASGDTTKSKGNFVVEIDDVLLSRGHFSYDILSAVPKDSVFDANHIYLHDLNARIRLSSINMQQLDVAVEELSFREHSGLTLENLTVALTSEGKVMNLKNLELQLPHSLLKIPHAMVDYTGMALGSLADSAKYTLALDVPHFRLADLKAFAPSLTNFADSIALQSSFSGRFPAVGIDSLILSYGNQIRLTMQASLADYRHWDTAPLEVQIPKLTVQPNAISEITTLTKKALPVHTAGIRLSAGITGALPSVKLQISAVSVPSGRLDINGSGGYVFRTGETHFDLNASAKNFDLKTLLNGNPNLGQTSFALRAAGNIDSTKRINAKAALGVDRFDFRQYPYESIAITASYVGNDAAIQLTSNDRCAPILLHAKANLSSMPSASLYLKTTHLMPDKLNLTPKYKDADLSVVLKADVRGFNPERMVATVTLDSVRFSTASKKGELETIRLNYEASDDAQKQFDLHSKLMTVDVGGHFTVKTIVQSVHNTLAVYFPKFIEPQAHPSVVNDSLSVNVMLLNSGQWTDLLDLPFSIVDTARLTAVYCSRKDHLAMDADFPRTKLENMVLNGSRLSLQADTINRMLHLEVGTIRFGVADTMHLGLVMETLTDSLRLGTKFNIITPKIKTGGELGLAASFEKVTGQKLPDISAHILPAMLTFNDQYLHIKPASVAMKGGEYEVDGFEVTLSDSEFVKVDGRVSRNEQDTLQVSLGKIQIGTLMHAIGSGINLTGEINGEIVANQLLTSPRILTDGFSIKDITFEKQAIGDLVLTSSWNKGLNAVQAKAQLSRDSAQTSIITGILFPQRDSMSVRADLRDVQLSWINPFTKGMLYNVQGTIGTRIKAEGKMKSPALSGMVTLKDANVGVSMLNVQYRMSDSIQVFSDKVMMKNFRITDESGQQAVINGEVQHTGFKDFRPTLSMNLQNFLLLNNPSRVDSLFYGTLRMSGSVNASGSGKDMLLKVALRNSPDSKVFVNLPEDQASQARQYKSVTFVNKDPTVVLSGTTDVSSMTEQMPKLPLRLQLALEVTPGMQLSAIYNPKTKDDATVKGTGKIDFSYNLADSKMNLLGEYKISEGKATVSLKNITKREFTIQPGGVVRFKGDPTATEFDVTAVYKLRADLSTLDPTVFATGSEVSRKRVNTECHISVSGSMEKITVGYAILFPDEDESVQRKADALMPTDEIKVKEIAYLLVGGAFYPVANTEPTSPGNNIWTSLASSAATSLLNSILNGVLSDNWTIGTDLYSDDGDASNMAVDVNISTNLFNNRLTVSSNIGYKSSSTNDASNTNFTGDFDVQYKITNNVILKMYNVTNDQLYDQGQTTQGVGVLYRRESKRFWDLFKRAKKEK